MWLSGEGNGKPLQFSCLENPMDRGACWAAVHGVTESGMTEWLTVDVTMDTVECIYLLIALCLLFVSFILHSPFLLLPLVHWAATKNTINWVAYKKQKFVSLSSRGWKSEIRVLSHGPLLSCRLVSSHSRRGWGYLWRFLCKNTNPIHEDSALMT